MKTPIEKLETERSMKLLAWSLGRVLWQIQGLQHKIYYPSVFAYRHRIYVQYINCSAQAALTRKQARKYLRWLLEGHVGRHWDMLSKQVIGV